MNTLRALIYAMVITTDGVSRPDVLAFLAWAGAPPTAGIPSVGEDFEFVDIDDVDNPPVPSFPPRPDWGS